MRPASPPAHRLIAFWLIASAAVLAVPGPAESGRITLMGLHLLAALLLLRAFAVTPDGRPVLRLPVPLVDWAPLLIVPLFYWEVPLLAETLHGGRMFDAWVQGWDRALFGGEPSLELASAWPWRWLSEPLHVAYLSYYFIVLGIPALLYITGRRAEFRRVLFTLVVVALAHATFYVAFPVLGPRYLFPSPVAPSAMGPVYRFTHHVLEAGSSPGTAFPSSHVGEAVAVTIALGRELPRTALAVALLTALLALATVYGGFHYAADALAGAGLGVTGGLLAPRLAGRLGLPGWWRNPTPTVSAAAAPVEQSPRAEGSPNR